MFGYYMHVTCKQPRLYAVVLEIASLEMPALFGRSTRMHRWRDAQALKVFPLSFALLALPPP